MKATTLIFIIFVFLLVVKILKIIVLSGWILFGVAILWFITLYFRTHQENKKRKTPMPVFLTNPEY